ncbi:unnamed protein product [Mytilus coruscus]|uniref:MAM domain-containing protein n=1 Tax=Mytilus coruscus TaxID=42192 RepID=A0A6J7ZTI2_MYTCO|nr:unnamed protein product [Mytilus coruscus]
MVSTKIFINKQTGEQPINKGSSEAGGRYQQEVIIPVSSQIQLKCDDDLRVNNIEVTIRRSNTTCLTATEECTIPMHAIDTIEEECTKQVSCEVDIRNTTDIHYCLYRYGFFNVWYTCKDILDFSCDFESGLCNWSPGHDENRFRWKYGNRLNDHFYTPPVDHTSASTAGEYVYIYESSSEFGDIANLESGYIIAMKHQCLSFWYYSTNSRDNVYVYQNEENLFDLSDYVERKWHHIQISLDKKAYNSYKLVFKVKRGCWRDSHFGAIVIDDILIENQKCNSSLFECDFDTYSCHWDSQYLYQNKWVKQSRDNGHFHTGPGHDHSTASGRNNSY